MYHHSCWRKYISQTQFEPDDAIHLQDVCLSEARNLFFFRHVDEVIFTEREIIHFSHSSDYKRIVNDYGYAVGDVRSYVKKNLLINEYQEAIGFKERNKKNKSELVHDAAGGGDYTEAAIFSLGISDDQLLENVAPWLSKKIRDVSTVPWPPHLEEGEEGCELLLKLLTWLKQPGRKTVNLSPTTLSLASLITYYVTGQRTLRQLT